MFELCTTSINGVHFAFGSTEIWLLHFTSLSTQSVLGEAQKYYSAASPAGDAACVCFKFFLCACGSQWSMTNCRSQLCQSHTDQLMFVVCSLLDLPYFDHPSICRQLTPAVIVDLLYSCHFTTTPICISVATWQEWINKYKTD